MAKKVKSTFFYFRDRYDDDYMSTVGTIMQRIRSFPDEATKVKFIVSVPI